DFWTLQYALPQESRNHVKKFIGTHYVMEGTGGVTTVTSKELAAIHEKAIEENKNAVNRTFSETGTLRANLSPEQMEGTIGQKIQGKYNSVVLANSLSFDIGTFNKLNPNFDKLVPEEEGYELRLPSEKMQQFNSMRYQILQQSIMASLQSVTSTPEGFPEPKPAKTTASQSATKKRK
ncbi:MAG: hypothetical protein MUE71_05845, partial [Chitinophagaceae bacterium]|nr:hypothetical protein [Chitinophagaceae bacterium]